MRTSLPKIIRRSQARILVELRNAVHPISVAELYDRLRSQDGRAEDKIHRKRTLGQMSVLLRELGAQRAVWSPLEGFWTYTDGSDYERLTAWIGVLADEIDDNPRADHSRTLSVLVKFCKEYQHGLPETENLEEIPFKQTALQVYLALLNSGDGTESKESIHKLRLIDLAIVSGLEGASWLSQREMLVLLPEIVKYVKRTAFVPWRESSTHSRKLTVLFIARLASQYDIAARWDVVAMEKAEDTSTKSRWERINEDDRLRGSLEWGGYVKFGERSQND